MPSRPFGRKLLKLRIRDRDVFPIIRFVFHNRKGLIVMLVCMDFGARPDGKKASAVAFCLFEPKRYEYFVRKWEKMLKSVFSPPKPPPPYFHSKEFFHKRGVFDGISNRKYKEITNLLPILATENLMKAVICSINQEEAKELPHQKSLNAI